MHNRRNTNHQPMVGKQSKLPNSESTVITFMRGEGRLENSCTSLCTGSVNSDPTDAMTTHEGKSLLNTTFYYQNILPLLYIYKNILG